MKKLINRYCLLTVIVAALVYPVQAQYVKPYAHYPLDAKLMFPAVPSAEYMYVNPYDVSGNGKHATVVNEPGFQEGDAPGSFLKSVKKNAGVNAYISMEDPFDQYDVSPGISISFWIKPDNNTGTQLILSTPNFQIKREGNTLRIGSINFLSIFQANVWNFVCFTYRPNDIVIYYASSSENFLHQRPIISSNGIGVYAVNQILSTEFGGSIRDVRFFRSTLSSQEVLSLMNFDKAWFNQTDDPQHILHGTSAHYPVKGPSGGTWIDEAGGNNGNVSGTQTLIVDRFGRNDEAVDFSDQPNSFVNFSQSFFKRGYDPTKGITVSFWTNIPDALGSSTEGATPPFTANDPAYSIVSGVDTNNNKLFGLEQINDRVVIDRYTITPTGNTAPYKFWLRDEASFRQQTGWYHIILVYHPNYMKIFVGKPDGTLYCQYNHQGIMTQDLLSVTQWYIGGYNVLPIRYLDEVRFFNWPLSDIEANALYEIEETNPGSGSGGAYLSASAEMLQSVSVYPNPSGGSFNVRLILEERAHVKLTMRDLMGKEELSEEILLNEGTHSLSYQPKEITSGIYIIDVRTGKWKKSVKILVNK